MYFSDRHCIPSILNLPHPSMAQAHFSDRYNKKTIFVPDRYVFRLHFVYRQTERAPGRLGCRKCLKPTNLIHFITQVREHTSFLLAGTCFVCTFAVAPGLPGGNPRHKGAHFQARLSPCRFGQKVVGIGTFSYQNPSNSGRRSFSDF